MRSPFFERLRIFLPPPKQRVFQHVLVLLVPLFALVSVFKVAKVLHLHKNHPHDILFTLHPMPYTVLNSLYMDALFLFCFGFFALWALHKLPQHWYASLLLGLRVTFAFFYVLVLLDHLAFVVTGSVGDWYSLKLMLLYLAELKLFLKSQHLGLILTIFLSLSAFIILGASFYALRQLLRQSWDRDAFPPLIKRHRRFLLGLSVVLSAWFVTGPPTSRHPLTYSAFLRFFHGFVEDITSSSQLPSTLKQAPPPFATHALKAQKTPKTKPLNFVFLILESARASSLTPYNPKLPTTPFLNKLAKRSLVVDNMYAVVPHTSKALVSLMCGVYPRIAPPISEAEKGGLPAQCIPRILRKLGYQTAFFQSPSLNFEHRRGLLENFGFQEAYSMSDSEQKGFERINYFGYEDRVMLKPSLKWLDRAVAKKRPFFMSYLTITSHHDYQLPKNFPIKHYTPKKQLNRYYNTLRYTDQFIADLFKALRKRKLLENTVFLIVGDHGEGFGEHNRKQHNTVIWEEGVRVPAMIVHPHIKQPRRIKGVHQQTDFLPTIAHMLKLKLKHASLPGRSLLLPPKPDRTVFMSCWYENRCMAMRQGNMKYIYHFGWAPMGIYDLQKDPLERKSLFALTPASKALQKKRKQQLLRWLTLVNHHYEKHTPPNGNLFSSVSALFRVNPSAASPR